MDLSLKMDLGTYQRWGTFRGCFVVSFQLTGPAATPATIRLDNLAILYEQPKIKSIEVQTHGGTRFTVEGKIGSRYAVEVSIDPATWNQTSTLQNQTGTVEFVDAETAVAIHRFYRVRIIP